MALATNSTPGEVNLNGDLKGSNDPNNPELTPSGTVPGNYVPCSFAVNSKGLIVNAQTGSFGAFPDASESVKGVMQVGSGLNASSGIVSIDDAEFTSLIQDATELQKGIMQCGNGLDSSSGLVNVDLTEVDLAGELSDASSSVKGVARFGTNITDEGSGSFGIANASGAVTKGVVKSADTTHLTITAGDIDVGSDVAMLDESNTFTAAQRAAYSILSDGASITPDLDDAEMFEVTLTEDSGLSAPSNGSSADKQEFNIIVKQDSTGGHALSFAGVYKIRSVPTLISTRPNSVSVITCVLDSVSDIKTIIQRDFV